MTLNRANNNRIPKDERLRQILDVATELFSSKGFPDTTMDDIAAGANITKRTLYRYVRTKESLLLRIHEEFAGDHLTNINFTTDEPLGAMNELIAHHIRTVANHAAQISVFFNARKHLAAEDLREVNRARSRYESLAIDALAEGQRLGVVAAEVEPKTVGRAILGSLTELYHWYDAAGALTPDDLAATIQDTVMNGVCRQEPLVTLSDAVQQGTALWSYSEPSADAASIVRQAAVKSFARVGYRASSIRELAESAGLTKGAVMYHVGYKDKLLQDVVTSVMEDGIAVLTRASDLEGTAPERFARVMGAHLAFLADRIDDIAVANENLHYLDSSARNRVLKLRAKWTSVVETVIDDGVAEACFATDNAFVLRHFVVGMLNATYRWYRPDGRITPAALAETYARTILYGVAAHRTDFHGKSHIGSEPVAGVRS